MHVVCNFGTHDFVYAICVRDLARMIDTKFLQPAPPPTKWAVCRTKSSPAPRSVPIDENFSPKSVKDMGLILMYKTAGRYHNGMQAAEELRHIPRRGGMKSVVVVDSDSEDNGADSTDTEYDTDGEPKPKPPKPTARKKNTPKRRRVARKPWPENMAYRDEIVQKQSESTVEVFTLNGLGEELCTVFAQLLRCFELSGSWEGAFAHFYTNRDWLQRVGVQALDARNDFISVTAVNLLTQLRGGLSK